MYADVYQVHRVECTSWQSYLSSLPCTVANASFRTCTAAADAATDACHAFPTSCNAMAEHAAKFCCAARYESRINFLTTSIDLYFSGHSFEKMIEKMMQVSLVVMTMTSRLIPHRSSSQHLLQGKSVPLRSSPSRASAPPSLPTLHTQSPLS
jgi:hypothetical protein